jgi:hypothetical protein
MRALSPLSALGWARTVIALFFVALMHLCALAQQPDLSGTTQEERESIESACSYDKVVVGPAAYHRCVQNQLNSLSGTRTPDLSGTTQEERESIESACSYDKVVVGPAAYHRCVQNQLNELERTTGPGHPTALLPQTQLTPSTIAKQSADPSPEIRKLAYFIGTWTLEGETLQSPLGVAGRLKGMHRNAWTPDGVSLASQWDEQRSSGNDSGEALYGYNSDEKVYTYHSVSSTGEIEDSKGTLSGNVWIWTSILTVENGNTLNGRFTMREVSPTSYSFTFEIAPASGEWARVMQGTGTKTK